MRSGHSAGVATLETAPTRSGRLDTIARSCGSSRESDTPSDGRTFDFSCTYTSTDPPNETDLYEERVTVTGTITLAAEDG